MPTAVSYNGVTYNIPGAGEQNWSGANGVDGFLIALGNQSLQQSGGLFALSADLDIGPNAGLIATYLKSRSANIAQSGYIRMANTDGFAFRNYANSADLLFTPNSSNQLTFNGSVLITTTGTLNNNTAAVVNGSGAIASASLTNNALVLGSSSSGLASLSNGSQYQPLVANASGSPSFQALNIAQSVAVTGVLPVANGGTNSSTSLNNNRVMVSSGGAIVEASAVTASRALASDSNGLPTASTTTSTELGYVHGVTSAIQGQISSLAPNLLINSAFDFWQRGTSTTVSNASNGYQADRWYVNNALGTSGVLTYSQQTGSLSGSLYGAQIQVTTAPGTASSSGINFVQVLDNLTSSALIGNSASFQCWIKALGNVTQVTLALVYATSETKPTLTNTLGTQTVTVNTSNFTQGNLVNISCPIGTVTRSGVVGVYIYVSGVSTGHVSDLNNGFILEQAMLVAQGTQPTVWYRAGKNTQEELAMCQRYYESSYDLGVTPGTMPAHVPTYNCVSDVSNNQFYTVWFKVLKRTASGTIFAWTNTTANVWSVSIAGAGYANKTVTGTQCQIGEAEFTVVLAGTAAGQGAIAQGSWAYDADI